VVIFQLNKEGGAPLKRNWNFRRIASAGWSAQRERKLDCI